MIAETIAALRHRVVAEPASVAAWLALADALQHAGEIDQALAAVSYATTIEPENPRPYRALAAAYRAKGEQSEAMTTDLGAMALETRTAQALFNVATACFHTGRYAAAKRWYELTLRLDPAIVSAHIHLAVILEAQGQLAAARHHRDEAYRRQSVFIETSPTATRTVLILSASGTSQVPVPELFPPATTSRIIWFVDYARDGETDRLPPHDLIYNAMGDPDLAGPVPALVTRLLAGSAKPLLNRPDAVARTQRSRLPEIFADIANVAVPPLLRVSRADFGTAALAPRLAAAGIGFPLILRPVSAHGGEGMRLIETPVQLAQTDLGEVDGCYLMAYRDSRSADGYYRKYRMVFIDRRPYPYQLTISQYWSARYHSAEMLWPHWKREEEKRFLEDPARAVGEKAMAAIVAIAQRLDLDFCGVDFALLADGRVLVSEVSSTVLLQLKDSIEAYPYKHVHVPRIFEAFGAMISRRLAAPAEAGGQIAAGR